MTGVLTLFLEFSMVLFFLTLANIAVEKHSVKNLMQGFMLTSITLDYFPRMSQVLGRIVTPHRLQFLLFQERRLMSYFYRRVPLLSRL